ncbi:MAG: DNA-binding protein Alba [Candidatus Aenigmarchaeota archaeon]|nr:DNA-binding protein Alba [Candidatus Aenigmarchaeota archaeon]
MAEENAETRSEAKESKYRFRENDNVIFVGSKPTMSYVLAVMTQFSGGTNEVHIKARGRSISRAVDVVEVVKNRFVNTAKHTIEIGTEKMHAENNMDINVSTIDIKLVK